MVDGFINFNLNEKTPTIIKVIGVGVIADTTFVV